VNKFTGQEMKILSNIEKEAGALKKESDFMKKIIKELEKILGVNDG
jgi:hypothetical protein